MSVKETEKDDFSSVLKLYRMLRSLSPDSDFQTYEKKAVKAYNDTRSVVNEYKRHKVEVKLKINKVEEIEEDKQYLEALEQLKNKCKEVVKAKVDFTMDNDMLFNTYENVQAAIHALDAALKTKKNAVYTDLKESSALSILSEYTARTLDGVNGSSFYNSVVSKSTGGDNVDNIDKNAVMAALEEAIEGNFYIPRGVVATELADREANRVRGVYKIARSMEIKDFLLTQILPAAIAIIITALSGFLLAKLVSPWALGLAEKAWWAKLLYILLSVVIFVAIGFVARLLQLLTEEVDNNILVALPLTLICFGLSFWALHSIVPLWYLIVVYAIGLVAICIDRFRSVIDYDDTHLCAPHINFANSLVLLVSVVWSGSAGWGIAAMVLGIIACVNYSVLLIDILSIFD